MRRVLHLRSSGGFLGAESVIIQIAKNSEKHGFQSIIGLVSDISTEGHPGEPTAEPIAEPELAQVAREHNLPCKIFYCSGRLDLKCAQEIRSFVRENAIDCIHCHGYKEDFYALLARTGLPLIGTNHLWKNTTTALKVYSWIDTLCLFFFDQIVSVSKPILDEMNRRGLGRKPMQIIANGVDIDIDPKSSSHEFGLEPDDFVFTIVGSLTQEKGHIFLIRALARLLARSSHTIPSRECLESKNTEAAQMLPIDDNRSRNSFEKCGLASELDETGSKIKLLIVGDGPERPSLQNAVRELKLDDRVIFTGVRRDIPCILKSTNVFVLPSLMEGLPMALLEAMAASLPVIASSVGDVPKAVDNGQTGLLVEPRNIEMLVDSMRKMFSEPLLRETLGQRARKKVEENFSADHMTEEYCKVYKRALHVEFND